MHFTDPRAFGIVLGILLSTGTCLAAGARTEVTPPEAEFKQAARAEISKATDQSDESNSARNTEEGAVIPTGRKKLTAVSPEQDIVLTEEDQKMLMREMEREKNWLVDGVRKLSGDQPLTDEEQADVNAPGSRSSMVDRFVAVRDQNQEDHSAREDAHAQRRQEDGPDEDIFIGRDGGQGHASNRPKTNPYNSAPRKPTAGPANRGAAAGRNPFANALSGQLGQRQSTGASSSSPSLNDGGNTVLYSSARNAGRNPFSNSMDAGSSFGTSGSALDSPFAALSNTAGPASTALSGPNTAGQPNRLLQQPTGALPAPQVRLPAAPASRPGAGYLEKQDKGQKKYFHQVDIF